MKNDTVSRQLVIDTLIPVEIEIYPPVDIAAAETEAVIPLEMMDKLLRGGAK